MSEAIQLIITRACYRENIALHPDTELVNVSPGIYQFTHYQPDRYGNCKPERVTAIIKGLDVRIQR